jgi:hypothetical protein
MSAQINGDGLVSRREVRHLCVPVATGAGKPMNKYDCRGGVACDDMMYELHRNPLGVICSFDENGCAPDGAGMASRLIEIAMRTLILPFTMCLSLTGCNTDGRAW